MTDTTAQDLADAALDTQVRAINTRRSADPYRQTAANLRGLAVTIGGFDFDSDVVAWKPDHQAYMLDCMEWFKTIAAEYEARADARDSLRRDLEASLARGGEW